MLDKEKTSDHTLMISILLKLFSPELPLALLSKSLFYKFFYYKFFYNNLESFFFLIIKAIQCNNNLWEIETGLRKK